RTKDRSLRTIKVRGREIQISSSGVFAGADFRISVSFLGSSHFIFLDIFLLKWLKGVLQRAMEDGWKLGKGLLMRSGSRVIRIGSFFLKDVWFLRIMEICGNGRRFFILIPMDEMKLGWGFLLKSVQSVLKVREDRQISANGSSYVEVLGRGLGVREEKVRADQGLEVIWPPSCVLVPSEAEVEARSRRLSCWVMMNLVLGANGFIVWKEFRKWLDRWWGVSSEYEIKLLGDDSWLVECESEEMVSKIVEKGKWFFRGALIEVRRWFSEAGRLNLLEQQGLRWVLAFGIPVHLRDDKVFRLIGDKCGGFVDCQDTGFSAVCLKVRSVGVSPSMVNLMALDESFEVKILEEPSFVASGDKRVIVVAEDLRSDLRSEESWSKAAAAEGRRMEAAHEEDARFGKEDGLEDNGLVFKPMEKESWSGGLC
ncbi:hypothetical protein LINPERHAP2_LOCUS35634, partial [Linum perenne]